MLKEQYFFKPKNSIELSSIKYVAIINYNTYSFYITSSNTILTNRPDYSMFANDDVWIEITPQEAYNIYPHPLIKLAPSKWETIDEDDE